MSLVLFLEVLIDECLDSILSRAPIERWPAWEKKNLVTPCKLHIMLHESLVSLMILYTNAQHSYLASMLAG